jgi:hypothetical protein
MQKKKKGLSDALNKTNFSQKAGKVEIASVCMPNSIRVHV